MDALECTTFGPFAANPASVPAPVVEQVLPRGTRTLILGSDFAGFDAWGGTNAENHVLELRLLGGQGFYLRRFALGLYQRVEIPCAAYRSFRLILLRAASKPSPGLVAIASTGPANSSRDERLSYPQRLQAGSDYEVPPGARRVWSDVNDPGWAWVSGDSVGDVIVPAALAAGVPQEVAGARGRPSTAVNLLWEIAL